MRNSWGVVDEKWTFVKGQNRTFIKCKEEVLKKGIRIEEKK